METSFSRDFSASLSAIDVKWLNTRGYSFQSQLFRALPQYILTNYFTPASISLMFASTRTRDIKTRRMITSLLTVKSLTSQLNAIFALAELLESQQIQAQANRLVYYFMLNKPCFLNSHVSDKLKARYNQAASNHAERDGLVYCPQFAL